MAWAYWTRHGIKSYVFAVDHEHEKILYLQDNGPDIYCGAWFEKNYTWYGNSFRHDDGNYRRLKSCEVKRNMRTCNYKVRTLPDPL